MTVIYSDRSLPLSKNGSNTLASALRLAWDFTGVGALANGAAWLFAGATNPQLVPSNQTLTTVNGEPCRVGGAGGIYDYSNTTDYGWQVGTGDFTIGIRANTSTAAVGTRNTELLRISGSSGTSLSVSLLEDSSVGWYASASGSCISGGSVSPVFYPPNTTIIIWIRRVSGQTSVLTQNATAQTAPAYRVNPGTDTTNLGPTTAERTIINFSSAGNSAGVAGVDAWNVGLSDANLTIVGKDFWNTNTNSAAADAIVISSPASGSTINGSSTISGTYTGTAPTGVDVQFGANAWVTGTGMTIGGGTWSGTFALTAGGPSTLQARENNATSIVSATVANITVNANTIAFSAPAIGTGVADLTAASYRIYQRNGSNQASVRIKGTYTGNASSGIEYSFNGSSYSTLVASPSGGVFNQLVTLTGPAQGNLSVRIVGTGIAATLTAVGVGDVYVVAGQSNNVGGGALGYVSPSAPSGHTAWVASIFDKVGVWRPNVETSTDPFSKTTNASNFPAATAEYSVQAASTAAYGSYFGALATQIMATGVPVAFVPCALGSTSIANWAISTSTTTLYGAALARATEIGGFKAVLWWQGEYDAGNGALTQRSSFEGSLNTLINDWCGTRFPGTKWVLMNLNSVGNGTGTSGTGATDTGFNAIHAAISNVGATNTNVAAVADMNTTTFAGIHYASVTEINAVANIAYNALNTAYGYSVALATTASTTLYTNSTTPAASLTGLKWAFFDQALPSAFAAPVAKGSSGSTNSSGVITVSITGTALPAGSVGWLSVTNSDGTIAGRSSASVFAGPVTVA